MSSLVKKVLHFVNQEELLQTNDRLVVACSGGPDSMTLLTFLLKQKKRLNLHLVVAQVDYQTDLVHIPRKLTEKCLERLPKEIVLGGRPVPGSLAGIIVRKDAEQPGHFRGDILELHRNPAYDTDDLRPQIPKDPASVGTRPDPAQVQDPYALQG